MRRLFVVSTLIAISFFVFCGPAFAKEGKIDFGLEASVAWSAHLSKKEKSDIRMGFDHLQILKRLHPNLQLVGELSIGAMTKPQGLFIGINGIGRTRFRTTGEWIPFFDLGIGAHYTEPKVVELSGTYQLSVIAGLGIAYQPRDKRIAYIVEYRLSHYSNANRQPPNIGLNLHTIVIGFNFL